MLQKSLLFLGVGLLGFGHCLASGEEEALVRKSLESLVPGRQPVIQPGPVEGLYEVGYGPVIVYVTKDGRYVLQGDMVEIESGKNLTEERRRQARLEAIRELDEKSMIVFAPKDKEAKYSVTVFTDVDCTYCAKFHLQVPELNAAGVKVRYIAYPRSGIPSPSYDKMVSVWCADDPQQAITDAKAGKSVPPKTCDNPVRRHLDLGQTLGIRGTPALFLENGEMIPGYVPAKQLVQALEEKAKSSG
jgi:thiol:disulfide interchange protein DsbC